MDERSEGPHCPRAPRVRVDSFPEEMDKCRKHGTFVVERYTSGLHSANGDTWKSYRTREW